MLREEIPLDSVPPIRLRAIRAVALVVASFAALALGALAAHAAGGNLPLILGIGGFLAYVVLFGRAVREFDLDRFVWDHPDWMLPRVSGRSSSTGDLSDRIQEKEHRAPAPDLRTSLALPPDFLSSGAIPFSA